MSMKGSRSFLEMRMPARLIRRSVLLLYHVGRKREMHRRHMNPIFLERILRPLGEFAGCLCQITLAR